MNKVLVCLAFVLAVFGSDQWIVVTTIQAPTPQLCKLAQLPGWRLVVVGDQKTPLDWHLDNCDYLSPQKQLELGYELSNLLPWNHYCRKNIGYLYAIEHGAKVIYETDDDNEPLDELRFCAAESELSSLFTSNSCLNIYSYFGCPEIWPRGFPLEKIADGNDFQIRSPSFCSIGIEQGVVNGSPDVDAVFRLTQNRQITFKPQAPCYLPKGIFCPCNSQNTFFHNKAFFTLYLPSTVSMRVSDVWRGYLAEKLLWNQGSHLAISGPNAVQERNPHIFISDFSSELDLYLKGSDLINSLMKWDSESGDPCMQMRQLYQDLIQEGYFQDRELLLLQAWLSDLRKIDRRGRARTINNGIKDYQGWCLEEKADLIIDLIRDQKPQVCVDLGTFGGAALSVIAKSLADNGSGIVFAVDAWSNKEAAKGFQEGSRLYEWWSKIDLTQVYFQFLQQLNIDHLKEICKVYKKTSAEASALFQEESIDFLHIDGNHSENGFFSDVYNYYPKVKEGGYILLNDANWVSARKAVIYLLENCELCIPYHEKMTYLLFKKSSQVEKIADQLWR